MDKTRKITAGAWLCLALLPPLLCAMPPGPLQAQAREESWRAVTDQRGRSVRIPDRPERIVALAPNIVEMIYDLGAGAQLAGRTLYSDYPSPALRLPQVGSYYRPDLERILALDPDLCLAVEDGTPDYVIEKLGAGGIPVISLKTASLDDLPEALLVLGRTVGREPGAVELCRAFQAETGRIRKEALARAAKNGKKTTALILLQESPIIAAGNLSFLGELLEAAGGENALKAEPGQPPYLRLSSEEILAMQPEVIIAPLMHAATDSGEAAAARPHARRFQDFLEGRGQIKAVAAGRVHILRADIFTRPGLRSLQAMRELLDLLYPQPEEIPVQPERQ